MLIKVELYRQFFEKLLCHILWKSSSATQVVPCGWANGQTSFRKL